jgi:hypothetical protein
MDSLQGCMFLEVWIFPTWESSKSLVLAPHLAVLPPLHVQNTLNLSLNM